MKVFSNKINKIFVPMGRFAKFAWSQVLAYPKSAFLYLIIIYMGLFTELSRFTIHFHYQSVGYYILFPELILLIYLLFIIHINGKNFFINTTNVILLIYLILLVLFGQGSWSGLFIGVSLILYIFHNAIFSFLILISFPVGKKSQKHAANFYISFICILIIALLSYIFFYNKRLIN